MVWHGAHISRSYHGEHTFFCQVIALQSHGWGVVGLSFSPLTSFIAKVWLYGVLVYKQVPLDGDENA